MALSMNKARSATNSSNCRCHKDRMIITISGKMLSGWVRAPVLVCQKGQPCVARCPAILNNRAQLRITCRYS